MAGASAERHMHTVTSGEVRADGGALAGGSRISYRGGGRAYNWCAHPLRCPGMQNRGYGLREFGFQALG